MFEEIQRAYEANRPEAIRRFTKLQHQRAGARDGRWHARQRLYRRKLASRWPWQPKIIGGRTP